VGKWFNDFFLCIPQDPPSPTKQKPILFSASILEKFSLGKLQSSNITVPESPTVFSEPSTHATIQLSPQLSSFSISYGGLLGTSWD